MPINIKFIRAKFDCDACGAPTGIELDPSFMKSRTPLLEAFVEKQVADRVGGCSCQHGLYLCPTCTCIIDRCYHIVPPKSAGEIRQVVLNEYRRIEGEVKYDQ